MHYDRAIGSCTILLATFGYFHNRARSCGRSSASGDRFWGSW
ncbi:hypothetical protein QUB70_20575 [Microcoleus sp. A003_D6]